MAKKPLTININNADPSKTYDMTNVSKLNLIYDSNLADDLTMIAAGTTFTLKVCGNTLSYTFKNMSTSMPVLVKKGDSTQQFNGTFAQFYELYKGNVKWTPKDDAITGTSMADAINMGSYKKALTINSGAGNDTVTGTAKGDIIKGGAGNDTLKGGKGNDTIYAGAGNDKITGGKGNDKIYTEAGNDIVYFNAGDGADTLYKGKNSDTLVFNNFAKVANLKSGMTAKKSGNNLILNYTTKDTVTLSNYYRDGASVKTLKAKDGSSVSLSNYLDGVTVNTITGKKDVNNKLNGTNYNDLIKGNNKNDTINGGSGNDKMYGYAGADTIKGGNGNDLLDGGDGNDKLYGEDGNDTINGGNGDDKIKGGTGADIINAGAGKNNIYYSLGDGNDTIKYGGSSAHDTLIFDDGIEVSASFNGDDLAVVYSGYKNGTFYTNTINIKDFQNKRSVEYVKIGDGKVKSIDDYIHTGGTEEFYSTEENEYWYPGWTEGPGGKLTAGNHTFVFNYANTHGEDYFGGDIIMSPNVSSSIGYTDTFQYDNHSINGGGFEITYRSDDLELSPTMLSYAYYCDINPTKSKVVIKDKDRTYNVKVAKDAGTIDNSKVSGNLVTALDGTAGNTTKVISNQNYNYTSAHNVKLNYTYNGGHDIVDVGVNNNDTYNINGLSDTTHIRINEQYGNNDVINFTNTNVDDIRLIFDVTQINATYVPYNDYKNKSFFAYKGNVIEEQLIALENGYGISEDKRVGSVYVSDYSTYAGDHHYKGIETIKINGTAVDSKAWYEAVATRAGQWLRSQTISYSSVASAMTAEGEFQLTEEQKQELVNCYKSVKYSDIVKKTVSSGGTINLAANKFNRYSFTGNYGGTVINSGNTVRNGYSDTLFFNDGKYADGTLDLSIVDGASAGKKDLCITTTVGETKKTVKYSDFMTGNSSELVVYDSDNRGISVAEYGENIATYACDFGNNYDWGSYNVVCINNDGSHSSNGQQWISAGGKSKNYVYLEGGIGAYLQADNITHTTIINKSASDDEYYVSVDGHIQIEDNGGSERLHVSFVDWDEFSAVANVTANYVTDHWEYSFDRNHVVYVNKDNITADTLSAATADHLVDTVGTNILDKAGSGGMTEVGNTYTYANLDDWYGQIKQEVGGWLAANHYGSVAAVVDGGNATDIANLVAAFKSVNYDPAAALV